MKSGNKKCLAPCPGEGNYGWQLLTGHIWQFPTQKRDLIVRQVCHKMVQIYGLSRFHNPKNPLDDLIYLIITNRTGPKSAIGAFRRLKEAYPSWDELLIKKISSWRKLLAPAGLSQKKSVQIRALLYEVRRTFGKCDLKGLKNWPDQEIESFLTSLPGVSLKVAKCVMIYTLNRQVLPVDVHVHRVAVRLGWTERHRADQCHLELEALVPPRLRAGFHITCISHGRELCRSHSPLCTRCKLTNYCKFFKEIKL